MSAAEIHSSAVESLYAELYPLLVSVGVSKFGIAEEESRALANEVFVDYLSKSDRVYSHRSFLVAAMCNASRYFLRVESRSAALAATDESSTEGQADVTSTLEAKQALGCLTPRCQFALHLRYYQGYTVPEIAAEFRTTVKYAEKVVRDCIRQAQRRYAGKEV